MSAIILLLLLSLQSREHRVCVNGWPTQVVLGLPKNAVNGSLYVKDQKVYIRANQQWIRDEDAKLTPYTPCGCNP